MPHQGTVPTSCHCRFWAWCACLWIYSYWFDPGPGRRRLSDKKPGMWPEGQASCGPTTLPAVRPNNAVFTKSYAKSAQFPVVFVLWRQQMTFRLETPTINNFPCNWRRVSTQHNRRPPLHHPSVESNQQSSHHQTTTLPTSLPQSGLMLLRNTMTILLLRIMTSSNQWKAALSANKSAQPDSSPSRNVSFVGKHNYK